MQAANHTQHQSLNGWDIVDENGAVAEQEQQTQFSGHVLLVEDVLTNQMVAEELFTRMDLKPLDRRNLLNKLNKYLSAKDIVVSGKIDSI